MSFAVGLSSGLCFMQSCMRSTSSRGHWRGTYDGCIAETACQRARCETYEHDWTMPDIHSLRYWQDCPCSRKQRLCCGSECWCPSWLPRR